MSHSLPHSTVKPAWGMYGIHPHSAVAHQPVLFVVGQGVRVRSAYPLGHIRVPGYCRGKEGHIERLCGIFPNPEELAYQRAGLPAQPLYRVRFAATTLWAGYTEDPRDVVEIEIYQHHLEPLP